MTNRRPISRRLRTAIRRSVKRRWRLALEHDLPPNTLSAWVSGARRPAPDDPRLFALAKALRIPESEVFEPDDQAGDAA